MYINKCTYTTFNIHTVIVSECPNSKPFSAVKRLHLNKNVARKENLKQHQPLHRGFFSPIETFSSGSYIDFNIGSQVSSMAIISLWAISRHGAMVVPWWCHGERVGFYRISPNGPVGSSVSHFSIAAWEANPSWCQTVASRGCCMGYWWLLGHEKLQTQILRIYMYVNVLFNCVNQSTVSSVYIYIYVVYVYVYRNACISICIYIYKWYMWYM